MRPSLVQGMSLVDWEGVIHRVRLPVTSKTGSGYVTLPEGLAMQWGRNFGDGHIEYPVLSFSNPTLTVSLGRVGGVTTRGFDVFGTGGLGFTWSAIG